MTTDSFRTHSLVLGMIVASTALGLIGTDLVLPAVPSLPEALGGDAAAAQLVLAAYVGGTAIGLLIYGALGDRFGTRALLVGSLLLTGVVSLACAAASDIWTLISLRALQGAVASGPAVFAPGIVKAMFGEARAVRALGLLGSIESLAPALAPILGAWLLTLGGWRLSFELIGAIALLLAAAFALHRRLPQATRRPQGSYRALLGDPVYLRYCLSHALTLGGLLIFVFGAPAVFVRALGADLSAFIAMQVTGIATFIIAANVASSLATRFGPERMITIGTFTCFVSGTAILAYALSGGTNTWVITALFVPMNTGLGLRGPPGFFRAVVAAHGDDARGAALVILGIVGVTALGTATVAPFIEQGLVPLALACAVAELGAFACLALPRLVERPR
ncbi:MFS transporter [Sphingoaurantiacus capsulatus]|uniref:MFS transporter n=1 Tax=Sphingoaurantiacus capsulatus TaxID=1771310 RepID=A0ABV7XA36_9SPHN